MLSAPTNKVLSAFGLAMINVIAIDSIRNLPLNAEFGYAIATFYLIGALFFFIPCILITARLAHQYPNTGGSYLWVKAAFGPRLAFVNAWLQWMYNIVWFPTMVTFIAGSVAYLFNPSLIHSKAYLIPMGMGVFTLSAVLNSYGGQLASKISNIGAIIGTVIPLVTIILLGVYWLYSPQPLATPFHLTTLIPKVNHFSDLSFLVVVLFSLLGIELSAVHAGDVKNPKKDFPKALWLSGGFILLSMIFASIAIVLILSLIHI